MVSAWALPTDGDFQHVVTVHGTQSRDLGVITTWGQCAAFGELRDGHQLLRGRQREEPVEAGVLAVRQAPDFK